MTGFLKSKGWGWSKEISDLDGISIWAGVGQQKCCQRGIGANAVARKLTTYIQAL